MQAFWLRHRLNDQEAFVRHFLLRIANTFLSKPARFGAAVRHGIETRVWSVADNNTTHIERFPSMLKLFCKHTRAGVAKGTVAMISWMYLSRTGRS